MEDNFGSIHGMNCLNQRETLRVEKPIQIMLAFQVTAVSMQENGPCEEKVGCEVMPVCFKEFSQSWK